MKPVIMFRIIEFSSKELNYDDRSICIHVCLLTLPRHIHQSGLHFL